MSKMNICKNEENWTCGNNEVVVDNPLKDEKPFYNQIGHNDMDYTRVSGTEPSSIILSQTKRWNWNVMPK